jgi:lipoprotein-anchoring transpeptidase ErfK/SrfK
MLRLIVISILATGAGFLFGLFVFPNYYSGQTPLDPTHLTGEYNSNETTGVFFQKPISSSYVPPVTGNGNVFGASTAEKRIEVDLSSQRLYAFEKNKKIFDFPMSSGLWGKTPTGEFRIWIKLRYTRMEGGSEALGTYYNLPNVPFTMFFYNDTIPRLRGFGIHGAYWHNNFGHPMSHGCINLKTEDAEKLYYWADPSLNGKPSVTATNTNRGTRIIIYGAAPAN